MGDRLNYVPYVYLIGWSDHDLWYLGCELKNSMNGTAHPSNLWVSYFTSSYHVTKTRERLGEPNVIQVRRTFDTGNAAHAWEQKALRRLGAVSSRRWLNKRIFNDKSFPMDDDIRAKIIESRRASGKPWHSEDAGRRISEAKKGVPVIYSSETLRSFGERLRQSNTDPIFQAKREKGCRRRWADEQQVQDQSERMRRNTHSEEARSKVRKIQNSPEFKEAAKHRGRATWADRSAKMRAGREAWWADPANRLAHAEKMALVRKARAVFADGVTHASARACAEAHGRCESWVYSNIKKGRFQFVTTE